MSPKLPPPAFNAIREALRLRAQADRMLGARSHNAFVAVDAAIASQEALVLDDKALVEIPANRLAKLAPLAEGMGLR